LFFFAHKRTLLEIKYIDKMGLRKVYVIRVDFNDDSGGHLYKVMTGISGEGNIKARVKRMIPFSTPFEIISTFDDLPHHSLIEIKKRLHKGGCSFFENQWIMAPVSIGEEEVIAMVMG